MARTNQHINQQNDSNHQELVLRTVVFQNHPNLLIRDLDWLLIVAS